jgi:hypothetical protein
VTSEEQKMSGCSADPELVINKMMKEMIRLSLGNLHDIFHFIKVHSLARTIGLSEGLDAETQETLEAAAILHDIACPLCREKYGNTNGKHQEEEGEILAADFLSRYTDPKDGDPLMTEKMAGRIVYLVGHHHTYANVRGIDYQILIEADFLVNADESGFSSEAMETMFEKVFRTKTGIALLGELYGKK